MINHSSLVYTFRLGSHKSLPAMLNGICHLKNLLSSVRMLLPVCYIFGLAGLANVLPDRIANLKHSGRFCQQLLIVYVFACEIL